MRDGDVLVYTPCPELRTLVDQGCVTPVLATGGHSPRHVSPASSPTGCLGLKRKGRAKSVTHNVERVHRYASELLHMDVQGAELPFLQSLPRDRLRDAVRFVMLSTHHSSISGSPTTHADCLALLRARGAHVMVEHDVIASYSGDGLVLASFYEEDAGLDFPPISRNVAATSLFQTP